MEKKKMVIKLYYFRHNVGIEKPNSTIYCNQSVTRTEKKNIVLHISINSHRIIIIVATCWTFRS